MSDYYSNENFIIVNGYTFLEDGHFSNADICVENGYIADIVIREGSSSDVGACNAIPAKLQEGHSAETFKVIDAQGKYVIPGLVDIHTHGAVGCDFSNGKKEELIKIAEYERSIGVTSFLPTSMSLSEEKLKDCFVCAKEVQDAGHSQIAGINMEGPFISLDKAGAQNRDYICPADKAMFNRLFDSCGGFIKLVTVAPEASGVIDFIRFLEGNSDVRISLGHTCADYETSKQAIEAGANHVTHLYNAMNGLNHREPGLIGAALDNDKVYVEIICDLVHIHPAAIRAAFSLFGDKRIVLISDSMEATGMPDGEYELGGQKVYKKASVATLEDGTLAGSVSNLMDCMKNAVKIGIPLESAIRCATMNPSSSIGMENEIGYVKVGALGNMIIMDDNLEIKKIINPQAAPSCRIP